MLEKQEVVKKTIRVDLIDSMALDILSEQTSRSYNEVVNIAIKKILEENVPWLAKGFVQTYFQREFLDVVEHLLLPGFYVKEYEAGKTVFNCQVGIYEEYDENKGGEYLYYPIELIPLNNSTAPNLYAVVGYTLSGEVELWVSIEKNSNGLPKCSYCHNFEPVLTESAALDLANDMCDHIVCVGIPYDSTFLKKYIRLADKARPIREIEE